MTPPPSTSGAGADGARPGGGRGAADASRVATAGRRDTRTALQPPRGQVTTMAGILVADRDETTRDLVTYRLERMRLAVHFAADGDQALRMAGTDAFDLLLLELAAPGLSGVDLCRALRANGDTTPVILLAGRVREEELGAAFAAGADDFLAKPIEVVELAVRVRRQLQRAPAGAGLPLSLPPSPWHGSWR